jgi:hypothetical protein
MFGKSSKALAIAAAFALVGTPLPAPMASAQAPGSSGSLAAAYNASGV